MSILEYRLWQTEDSYVPLYHYKDIELEQILARRECEFFIKDGITYKQLSSAVEGRMIAIYVEKYEEGSIQGHNLGSTRTLKLEIRELDEGNDHPLLETRHLSYHIDVLVVIGSVYLYVNGREYERDSAELDEDQQVYVMYVKPTGYLWEGE